MNSRKQQVSRAAIELIKQFEGYRRTAAQLEDGRWTIGYGHTRTARPGAQVSPADAEALLIYDLMDVAASLNDWVYTPLTQNQFDALAGFVFNIGTENFRRSGVLRRLNEGAYLQAACAMEMWRKADFEGERIVVDALVRRRAAEKVLFLTPTEGFKPVPSPILRPKVDHDLAGAVPTEPPVDVTTDLNGERATAERVEPAAIAPSSALLEQHEPPTASQVAAAAITARLQSILREDDPAPAPSEGPAGLDLPSPPVDAQEWQGEAAGPEAEPDADASFELTHPPVEAPQSAVEPEVEPVHVADPSEPQLFTAEPMTFESFDSQPIAGHAFEASSDLDDGAVEPIRPFSLVPAMFGLGAVGLAVFAGALFWTFTVRRAEDSLFSGPAIAGIVLGVLGISGVALAVYFLLERLGGREEQE